MAGWRFDEYLYCYNVENEEQVGKFDKIALSLDMSDPQLSIFVRKTVTEAMDSFAEEVSDLCKKEL